MRRRRVIGVVSGLLVIGALAGCATSSNAASGSSKRALEPRITTTTAPATATAPAEKCPIVAQPAMELPPPGDMPAGTFMADIRHRYLKVGVDENTKGFAWRNPQTGELEGFEIALVQEIARAIFGDPSKVKYISVVTNDKVDKVADGTVDLTASTVSITGKRACKVAFSEKYFDTPQKVMVNTRSTAQHLTDLRGDRVCVTQGSTTADLLAPTGLVPYPVETRTDCLVALQQGDVDAIATHETILLGLHQQDPKGTRILPESLPDEPQHYGVAIGKGHTKFVAFVNGVLEQLHANGTYDALIKKYVNPLYDVATEGAAQ
jgi:polar amino acid transport system substrate-binding protein